jgi:acetylornithine deacetylase/succinyl-diaminopimelate desuccinylase-like protein
MPDLAALVNERIDSFLGTLFCLLRFKSVSADPLCRQEISRCSDWLVDYLKKLLGHAEANTDYGLPVVYAETPAAPDRPTVLLYGHYDVQPAQSDDGWTTDPFEPQLIDGRMVARGIADNKGPLMVYLSALELLKPLGPLPVNVKVILEGEEESAGDAIAKYIEAHREKLRCDLIISTDAGGFGRGRPALTYGYRGMVYKQIDVVGPNQDLHSGSFGGIVPNPAQALVRILDRLVEPDGKINVPGLYDKVRPIDPEEHERIAALPRTTEQYLGGIKVKGLAGESEFLPMERLWCRPNLCINGIVSGYTGAGAKTVLPARASAKFSVRIVPDQQPEEVSELLDRAILDLADPAVDVTIQTLGTAEPFLGLRTGPAVDAACRASQEVAGVEPARVREGGTVPIMAFFKRHLTGNILALGFTTPDCGAHGPNEFFNLADFRQGIQIVGLMLNYLRNVK